MKDPASKVTILQFWKTNRGVLPLLAKAAQSILPVPCASSSVERVFSIAGLTVTQRRKSLVPKLVETIVIMRSNKERINFSDFKEEKEEYTSSDEDDVDSEPGESVPMEQEEVDDNEDESEGDNERETVSLVEADIEPSKRKTNLTQLSIATYMLPPGTSATNSSK